MRFPISPIRCVRPSVRPSLTHELNLWEMRFPGWIRRKQYQGQFRDTCAHYVRLVSFFSLPFFTTLFSPLFETSADMVRDARWEKRLWAYCTMGQNQVILRHQKITFPSARDWAKWVSGASKRANGRASGPVLTSLFLFVLDHSALCCIVNVVNHWTSISPCNTEKSCFFRELLDYSQMNNR